MKQRAWIDITVPIRQGMVSWPSDPRVEVVPFKDIFDGWTSNVSELRFGSHTGTHLDAPRHFFPHGRAVDMMPVEDMIGRARVIVVKGKKRVGAQDLKKFCIRQGEAVLLKTDNSRSRWWERPFQKDFVHLSLDGAEFLASRKIRMFGIDYLSVGGYKSADGADVHRALLGAGIYLLEGLDLTRTSCGNYDMFCLPLKLHKGDGSPARVILRGSESRKNIAKKD